MTIYIYIFIYSGLCWVGCGSILHSSAVVLKTSIKYRIYIYIAYAGNIEDVIYGLICKASRDKTRFRNGCKKCKNDHILKL